MKRSKLDFTFFVASASVLLCAIYYNGLALRRAWRAHNERPLDSYSYIGDDYPPSIIPLSQHKWNSGMFIEDTYHYSSIAQDELEWSSLFPKGDGFVRLGPDHRPFEISMYHQIRCMGLMQKAIFEEGATTEEARSQVRHCFNHIRQMLLCASSTKIEPFKPDPQVGTDKVDGLNLEHKCRDWSKLREIAEKNYEGWPEVLKANA